MGHEKENSKPIPFEGFKSLLEDCVRYRTSIDCFEKDYLLAKATLCARDICRSVSGCDYKAMDLYMFVAGATGLQIDCQKLWELLQMSKL